MLHSSFVFIILFKMKLLTPPYVIEIQPNTMAGKTVNLQLNFFLSLQKSALNHKSKRVGAWVVFKQ